MSRDIDFYFDFASPFAYFASSRIEQLAATHGRKVRWHPVLLVSLSQATGSILTPMVPVKWAYVQRELQRTAQTHGIAYRLPPGFPHLLLAPGRAFVWLRDTRGDEVAASFARTCYQAYFGDGVDINDVAVLQGIAARLGADPAALAAALADPQIKAQFKQESELALARGVFGVPFVLADGEPFWGFDRFLELEAWLRDSAQMNAGS